MLKFLAAALIALIPTGFAQAQDFPTKPVHIVVPFPPGGPGDVLVRLIVRQLGVEWPQPIIVENRPGAGTIISTGIVAKSAPDGHTFGLVSGSHTINPFIYSKLPYDTLNDLRGVSQIAVAHMAILARPTLEASTLADLISLSKSNPGKITFGTVTGTVGHLIGEMLNRQAGTSLMFVPYKGAVDARNDVLAGRLDLEIHPLTATSIKLVESGRLKAIAVTSASRTALAPTFPAAVETLPGFEAWGVMGFVAPKATPDAVVQRIQASLRKAMQSAEVRQGMDAISMEPVSSTPAEFDEFIRRDMQKWSEIVKATGIKAN